MTSFLLDANLSPESAHFLSVTFGLDVTDLITRGLGHLRDVDIVDLAKRESRIIITFDLDIGEIYHRGSQGRFGVMLLRLEDQTIESVNRALERFFRDRVLDDSLEASLIVVDDRRIRIVTNS